jgi:hypothetical protein
MDDKEAVEKCSPAIFVLEVNQIYIHYPRRSLIHQNDLRSLMTSFLSAFASTVMVSATLKVIQYGDVLVVFASSCLLCGMFTPGALQLPSIRGICRSSSNQVIMSPLPTWI